MACCCGRFDGVQINGLVGDLLFEKVTILGQPVSRLHTHVEVAPDTPQVVRFRNLTGDWFGGQLGGQARVEIGNKLAYDLEILVTQINLEQFATQPGPGLGHAGLRPGQRASVRQWDGNHRPGSHGTVKVPTGKLFRLPVLLDLLKFLGLRCAGQDAFGRRIRVQHQGQQGDCRQPEPGRQRHQPVAARATVNLDGTDLNLDFTRTRAFNGCCRRRCTPVPRPSSQQMLLKIEMRGKMGPNVRSIRSWCRAC